MTIFTVIFYGFLMLEIRNYGHVDRKILISWTYRRRKNIDQAVQVLHIVLQRASKLVRVSLVQKAVNREEEDIYLHRARGAAAPPAVYIFRLFYP